MKKTNCKAEIEKAGKRKRFALMLAFNLSLFAFTLSAFSLTSFTFQLYNSDGSANTNTATLAPVGGNGLTVYGTNLVFSKTISLVPNSSGFGTASALPNAYKLTMPTGTGVPISGYVNIPDTTNVFPLGMYVSNAPAIYLAASLQAFLTNALGIASITNLLGLVPQAATFAALTNTFGFAPATNSAAGIAAAQGFSSVTNSAAGITNTLGFALIPPTYLALTNALGFAPLASSYTAVTNVIAGVPVLTSNPQFILALTNANAFYRTNLPLLRGFTAVNGLTNAFVTNADGSFTPVVGWTNPVAPLFTGTISNAADGIVYRLNITNGIVVSTNTP